ncbi:MAG: rhomboid family intramembrane serine protease [Deltaproteobacteria bacterium]|nr:rhomboid family intramembrane serine protease [Deltaproteobacteria bacterium]MBK8239495.1 rhomboid family intramembrane serine protease [Deltaproteobacteria bacterium]MBK8719294.1 rhomboid family intramembrane serine protease [Deltaproteobacteria bacterium]MBP7289990.1 rhomboid family intramembrane serine protease [Nannocystaceae bacterium]
MSDNHPQISAQCPACGLHALVVVRLRRGGDGNWVQTDRRRLFGRDVEGDTAQLEVQIDTCPVCFGAWFDPGELDVLAGKLEGVEQVLDADSTPSKRGCVHGHGPMSEHRLPGVISTPLDRCTACGGLWLDGHERRKLAQASTSEGQGTKTERWFKRGAIWAAQVLTHLPVEVDNPARGTPWVVYLLLATFLAVFIGQETGAIDTEYYAIVAGRLKHEGDYATLLTYMFMHGSWAHLLFNAYFLYTFGDNVEHLFGRVRFAIFFVLAGVLAGGLHVMLTHRTATPVVGASGAIAAVLAAYLWAFPRARLFQVILWVQLKIPAWTYLFVWAAFQLLMGFWGKGADAESVAWFAHLGGFLVGVAVTPLVLAMRRREVARHVRVPALT